jgi:TetR/AcrR family transcriptional regulator
MNDHRRKSKEFIAKAAQAEFAEHGFSGARTDRIARLAGVNKQLIYYYYGSKSKLFEAMARLAAQGLSLQNLPASSQGSVTEKLRTHLKSLFDGLRARPDFASILIGGIREDANETAEEWGRQTVNTIASTISEGQGLGFFRDDADPQLAARQAVTLILGYSALGPIMDKDGESAPIWLDCATELLLGSLVW